MTDGRAPRGTKIRPCREFRTAFPYASDSSTQWVAGRRKNKIMQGSVQCRRKAIRLKLDEMEGYSRDFALHRRASCCRHEPSRKAVVAFDTAEREHGGHPSRATEPAMWSASCRRPTGCPLFRGARAAGRRELIGELDGRRGPLFAPPASLWTIARSCRGRRTRSMTETQTTSCPGRTRDFLRHTPGGHRVHNHVKATACSRPEAIPFGYALIIRSIGAF